MLQIEVVLLFYIVKTKTIPIGAVQKVFFCIVKQTIRNEVIKL